MRLIPPGDPPIKHRATGSPIQARDRLKHKENSLQQSNRFGQIGIPIAVVLVVAMMVVPIPTFFLDILLAVNITGAILILLTSMYVKDALDFSVFPSLLLIATLFRLALNVSVTRLVLSKGYAGKVVESFGHFVVGGSLIVGLVIFLILFVIQFIVITNGAGRVAEVAARFTLDAMPGKQMAIDADLNSGVISDREALARRTKISAEADFYGAMDGASKFVKGDAIAAIVITLINLVGGFIIGALQHHLSLQQSMQTYSLLSVGDGLVSQIPALLISISTGLVVTRAASEADMGSDLIHQFARQHKALQVAAGAIIILGLVPGLPKLPFIAVGGLVWFASTQVSEETQPEEEIDLANEEPEGPAPDSPEGIAIDMRVEPLELELAFDLVELVEPSKGGDLLDRVKALRRKLAMELGVVIPLVRTRDNLDLPPSTYAIRLHNVEAARGQAPAGTVLVIGDHLNELPGTMTKEPVFGLDAKWVPQEMRQQAELLGETVVDRSSVITTHLAEIVRQNAGRLLGRQDVKMLVDIVKSTDPVVIDELNTSQISLGEVQHVLSDLLEERIPIRDIVRILEVLSERGRNTKQAEALTEAVRSGLGPAISSTFAQEGRLPVITFDPMLEHQLLESARPSETGTFLAIDPEVAERIVLDVRRLAEAAENRGDNPVLLCAAPIRPAMRRLVVTTIPRLPVLSYNELGDQAVIETVGVVNNVNTTV